MKRIAFLIAFLASTAAVANPPAPTPATAPTPPAQPDPNAIVTLTWGELQALEFSFEKHGEEQGVREAIDPIFKKLHDQIAPKAPAK